jgi:predicted nucleotidyltransferase
MLPLIEQHRLQIEALCQKYGVRRLELFGSAARADFDPTHSDLDFLVEFEDRELKGSSNLYFGLLHGLEDLLHRRIDLVERSAVENRHFLEVAQQHRELLYAATIAQAS